MASSRCWPTAWRFRQLHQASVVFVVKKPTPQRTPTFNTLADSGRDFLVVYLSDDSTKNGWGAIEPRHPHVFVDDTWHTALKLLRLWFSRRVLLVALFGYRGPIMLSAAVCSRLLGRSLATRSDSNFIRIAAEARWKQVVRKIAVRAVLPRRTTVWTIGAANETYWREYLGYRRCTRIPYEVPALPNSMSAEPAVRRTDPLHVRVLYVGRLDSGKRVIDLVCAFRGLPEISKAWRLDIVGDGPDRPRLLHAAAGDERIHVHGAVEYEKLDVFYRQADVLVLPSAHEAWGLVVNEALGFGLWVVVSDQVGAKELLTSHDRGMIYPVKDVYKLRGCLRRISSFTTRRPVPVGTNTADLMADEMSRLSMERRGKSATCGSAFRNA